MVNEMVNYDVSADILHLTVPHEAEKIDHDEGQNNEEDRARHEEV